MMSWGQEWLESVLPRLSLLEESQNSLPFVTMHTSLQIAGGSQLSQGDTLSQSCLKVLNLLHNNLEVIYMHLLTMT